MDDLFELLAYRVLSGEIKFSDALLIIDGAIILGELN